MNRFVPTPIKIRVEKRLRGVYWFGTYHNLQETQMKRWIRRQLETLVKNILGPVDAIGLIVKGITERVKRIEERIDLVAESLQDVVNILQNLSEAFNAAEARTDKSLKLVEDRQVDLLSHQAGYSKAISELGLMVAEVRIELNDADDDEDESPDTA